MDNSKLDLLNQKDGINQEVTTNDLGYFKVNVKNLPSKGLFYSEDVSISVKPAGVKEIRHWSMIDESDEYSFVQAIDFILGRCVLIKTPKKILSINDLCEVDRLYLIFTIREYTFNDAKNQVFIDVPYIFANQEYKDSVVITKESLKYFNMPEKLMSFYDANKRAFVIGKERQFELRLPTIGVSNWIQNYVKKRMQQNKPFDEFFSKASLFLMSDYNMSDQEYFNAETESQAWGIEDISNIDRFTQALSKCATDGFTHKTEKGGVEVTVPLMFRHGVKSIFLISNILDELG